MRSPIRTEVGEVLTPVADLPRAADRYGRILGLDLADPTHAGTSLDLPAEGAVGQPEDPDGNALMVCQRQDRAPPVVRAARARPVGGTTAVPGGVEAIVCHLACS